MTTWTKEVQRVTMKIMKGKPNRILYKIEHVE